MNSNPDSPQAGPVTALDVLAASLADMPDEISCQMHGDAAVIKASAIFDHHAAHAVRDLTIMLQGGFVTRVVFDLSEVTCMGSGGLAVIAAAHKRLRQAGGQVAVAAATEPVARLFRLTGLYRHVPLYASVSEASR
jgi:stage II sporulation protein AA (anti-sigma F factor antagonist)